MSDGKQQSLLVRIVLLVIIVSIIGAIMYGGYRYYLLKLAYDTASGANANLQYESSELRDKLKASDALNSDLQTLLQARQQEKETAGQQVQALASTVNTLGLLAHTDKELLEKYSSVYFLNENYIPQNLTEIGTTYLSNPQKPQQVIAAVATHLDTLLAAAAADHVPLQVLSAYRSFQDQSMLKNSYKMTYGAGTANSFSADQGYSEHQLGTAIDFTTPTGGSILNGFDKTASYTWLANNAYLYGFNLSYPKGNIHFIFEPWHWRYVGIELAKRLHDEDKSLYDLDQRDIDTYLLKFFD
jgi:LAS superfamily LD-carboxypeptidase LdcB